MPKWARNIFLTTVLVACITASTYGLLTNDANTSWACGAWCGIQEPPSDEAWRGCFEGCLDALEPEATQ